MPCESWCLSFGARVVPTRSNVPKQNRDTERRETTVQSEVCSPFPHWPAGATCFTHFIQSHIGTYPITPNEQSIKRQYIGIPRTSPNTSAHGITSTHAILPNSNNHTFRTGSRHAPINPRFLPHLRHIASQAEVSFTWSCLQPRSLIRRCIHKTPQRMAIMTSHTRVAMSPIV